MLVDQYTLENDLKTVLQEEIIRKKTWMKQVQSDRYIEEDQHIPEIKFSENQYNYGQVKYTIGEKWERNKVKQSKQIRYATLIKEKFGRNPNNQNYSMDYGHAK